VRTRIAVHPDESESSAGDATRTQLVQELALSGHDYNWLSTLPLPELSRTHQKTQTSNLVRATQIEQLTQLAGRSASDLWSLGSTELGHVYRNTFGEANPALLRSLQPLEAERRRNDFTRDFLVQQYDFNSNLAYSAPDELLGWVTSEAKDQYVHRRVLDAKQDERDFRQSLEGSRQEHQRDLLDLRAEHQLTLEEMRSNTRMDMKSMDHDQRLELEDLRGDLRSSAKEHDYELKKDYHDYTHPPSPEPLHVAVGEKRHYDAFDDGEDDYLAFDAMDDEDEYMVGVEDEGDEYAYDAEYLDDDDDDDYEPYDDMSGDDGGAVVYDREDELLGLDQEAYEWEHGDPEDYEPSEDSDADEEEDDLDSFESDAPQMGELDMMLAHAGDMADYW
jgi:hypothetical protein